MWSVGFPSSQQVQKNETIYIINQAPHYISDARIEKDIPAWELAANRDFRPYWNSPQIQLKLVKQAPRGAITAVFKNNGPVDGALAFHAVFEGVPQIVVYAGVGVFYGYSNSVSFTHELFELLADQNINSWNWHWQSDPLAFYVGQNPHPLPRGAFWFNEVCDPVEAFAYTIHGVPISDFITPAWFGDGTNGGYDQMNRVHQPLQTLRGGYAQFMVDGNYNLITDFPKRSRDARGFLKGEKAELVG